MKFFHGIISVILGAASMYVFFTAKSDMELIEAFAVMLGSIIFLCFMMLEEKTEEVQRLKRQLLATKGFYVD